MISFKNKKTQQREDISKYLTKQVLSQDIEGLRCTIEIKTSLSRHCSLRYKVRLILHTKKKKQPRSVIVKCSESRDTKENR